MSGSPFDDEPGRSRDEDGTKVEVGRPKVAPKQRESSVKGASVRSLLRRPVLAAIAVGLSVVVLAAVVALPRLRAPQNAIRHPDDRSIFLEYETLPSMDEVFEHVGYASVMMIRSPNDGNRGNKVDPAAADEAVLVRTAAVLDSVAPSEGPFIDAFSTRLVDVFHEIGSFFGGHSVLIQKGAEPGVRFFQHEGEVGVFIPGLGMGVDFNTFNSDERDRLSRVLFESVIPELDVFVEPLGGTEIGLVGYGVHYGTRDFTDDIIPMSFPETVTIIAPLDDVKAYANLALTDTEVAERSMVFFGSGSGLRRIDPAQF